MSRKKPGEKATGPLVGILLAAVTTGAGMAVAQEQDDSSSADNVFSLGQVELIEVTGRQNQWNRPFGSVVTAEDIADYERNTLDTALNLMPGVTVQNMGGRSEKLIYVRGFNSRQVPLFMDGIPVYVPYDGNIDLSRLLVFDVAEIDVSKGLSSVLYGANTLGGSINVVSRRPEEGMRERLRSGFTFDDSGDYQGSNGQLTVEGSNSRWYGQATLEYNERDFFTLSDDFIPTPAEDGGERDNSASDDKRLSLKLGFTPNETDEYALSYQLQKGAKNTPPYAGSDPSVRARYWQWPQYDKESLYFISRTALTDTEYVRLRVYYDTFENVLDSWDDDSYSTQTRPYAFHSVYDDYTLGFSTELGSTRISNHSLKAALQLKRDVHRESDDAGSQIERMEDDLWSFGFEDTVTVGSAVTLVGGVGYDMQNGRQADDLQNGIIVPFDTDRDSDWNAQGGLVYALDENLQMHGSISRRTRFPTMKDRYSYRLGTALPNPGLQPETAVNMEIGVSGSVSMLEYAATLFNSRIDDTIESILIAPGLCSSPPCSQLQNIGEQENTGVELSGVANLGQRWTLTMNYTWLDRDNISSPQTLPVGTPENKVFAAVQFTPVDTLNFIFNTTWESGRFSNTTGSQQTDAFTVSDVKAVWRVLPTLQTEFGVNNLGDENYAYDEGYPEPGRTWYLNFRLEL